LPGSRGIGAGRPDSFGDPIAQFVTRAVEEGQGLRDDAPDLGFAQDACAVSGIEPIFDTLGEALVVFAGGGRIPGFRVMGEPGALFFLPEAELVGGE